MIDIARIARVSESAVSRALRDHPRISEATRERIKKIAAELDFDVNSHARSLSTRKSGSIGVIVPNFGADVRQAYYLELLINDIRAQLGLGGYDLLIAESGPSGASNLRRLVLQRKVDAVVLIIGDLSPKDRQLLNDRQVPVVVVNSPPLPLEEQTLEAFSSFFTDNDAGGALAADHLLGRGCRNLVCLADQGGGAEMRDRTTGFVRTAAGRGVPVRVVPSASGFDATYRTVLGLGPDLGGADGLFCHTDVMGVAALRALADQGTAVPARVRVVGYDDIELGTYFSPRLTTIHQPREAIADQACAHLKALLSPGGAALPVRHVSAVPRLVVRESS